MGLVEGAVGVLPAGGGLKEIVRRASAWAKQVPEADPYHWVRRGFEAAATAKVSMSAHEAREMGFLSHTDGVTFHKRRVIADAKRVAVCGFCYGGGVCNALAVAYPESACSVPFYGRQAASEDDAAVEARLREGAARAALAAADALQALRQHEVGAAVRAEQRPFAVVDDEPGRGVDRRLREQRHLLERDAARASRRARDGS